MTLDITTLNTIIEVKLAPLFACPYCGRAITQRNRVAYPAIVAHTFAPVYHCRCGKHFGEKIDTAVEVTEQGST